MPQSLANLAVGAKVKDTTSLYYGKPVIFKVADKNHAGFPANSVTLITERIVTIKCFDGKEPNNSDGNRRSYGNNRYQYANLLQWLNSNAGAGAWYSAKHAQDAPPNGTYASTNPYDTEAGFLNGFSANIIAAMLDTTQTVVRNTVTDGGSYETVQIKMFLPSTTEVGLANENNIAEGSKLALFSDNNSRLAYPTAEAVANSAYKNNNLNTSAAWWWWLRTPYASDSFGVRCVNTAGALSYGSAYYGNGGARPLCNLSSSILVSDNTDADGCYTIVWNRPPTTPSGISVPEKVYSNRNITVTWGTSSDPDGDAITYKLERSFNNGSWAQVASTAGTSFTEAVSTAWNTLQYRVKSVDSFGNQSAYIASDTRAVIHNVPPAISGVNGDLGEKTDDFSFPYTVTDEEGDAVTVKEAVDGVILKTYTAALGVQVEMRVAGNDFLKLANGPHTLTITANDTTGGTVARTMTFTKKVNGLSVTLTEPLSALTLPKRINIDVMREIPVGASFRVETCNNAFDDSPVWEDATDAVIGHRAHIYENTIQRAEKAGVNIRVTVERRNAVGPCWVSGIGGNFE